MTNEKTKGRKRVPQGKRQMLCILDEDVIERVKIAAVRRNSRVSHVVQIALVQWLARQEPKISEAGVVEPSSCPVGKEG